MSIFPVYASTLPLPFDTCQRLHFLALINCLNGCADGVIPSQLSLFDLRNEFKNQGSDILLSQPNYIHHVFKDVSLGIFLMVKSLYCSKYLRSPQFISEIINRLMVQKGKSPITYEAIWAICAYLWGQRYEKTQVLISKQEMNWYVFRLIPNVRTVINDRTKALSIICIINLQRETVIAFRVSIDQKQNDEIPLAVYDAITYLRRPSIESPDGVIWIIPNQIIVEEELPIDRLTSLKKIGIEINQSSFNSIKLVEQLRTNWDKDLEHVRLSIHQFSEIFNNYLKNIHGQDIFKMKKILKSEYKDNHGYMNDPANLFPLLRELFPSNEAKINGSGEIIWNNHIYENELLHLWTETSVNIRLSQESSKMIWVYIGDEMIGQAVRKTGTRKPSKENMVDFLKAMEGDY